MQTILSHYSFVDEAFLWWMFFVLRFFGGVRIAVDGRCVLGAAVKRWGSDYCESCIPNHFRIRGGGGFLPSSQRTEGYVCPASRVGAARTDGKKGTCITREANEKEKKATQVEWLAFRNGSNGSGVAKNRQ